MNNTRTPSELRKAATDAGWESDALASEILSTMDRLASEVSAVRKGPPPWAWVAVGVAVLASAATVFQTVRLTEARAERQGYAAAKEAEISNLKAANLAQIEAVAGKLNALVSAAESVSKTSATAADSNHAAVNLYMTQFQALLEEAKKLRKEVDEKAR